jgi:ATP-binding cassette, subfamily C (CFTR/MRP), member 1
VEFQGVEARINNIGRPAPDQWYQDDEAIRPYRPPSSVFTSLGTQRLQELPHVIFLDEYYWYVASSYSRLQDISDRKSTANASDQLTTIIIFAAAVFWSTGSDNLSISQVFTSLSVIALVSTPLVNLIAAYPTFASGLDCFERIQPFLFRDDRKEYRLSESFSRPQILDSAENIEMQSLPKQRRPNNEWRTSPVIRIKNASFSLGGNTESVLRDININLKRSSLAIIAGPVGSGKSALLKAMLGKTKLLGGSIQTDGTLATYCDQTAWLRFGSIRYNILGPNTLDEAWYLEVVHSCALDDDVIRIGYI